MERYTNTQRPEMIQKGEKTTAHGIDHFKLKKHSEVLYRNSK